MYLDVHQSLKTFALEFEIIVLAHQCFIYFSFHMLNYTVFQVLYVLKSRKNCQHKEMTLVVI